MLQPRLSLATIQSTFLLLLLVLLCTTKFQCFGFVVKQQGRSWHAIRSFAASSSHHDEKSSLSITTTTAKEKHHESSMLFPITMNINELSEYIEGKGRAQMIWNCYKNGIDPIWMYDVNKKESSDDDDDEREPNSSLLLFENEDNNNMIPSGWTRKEIYDSFGISKEQMGFRTRQRLLYNKVPLLASSIEYNVSTIAKCTQSIHDGTTKLLLKMLKDGLQVETVIIPNNHRNNKKNNRSTLCISSQVGCRQACRFCATGRMGLIRNLSSHEILSQVYWANKICRLLLYEGGGSSSSSNNPQSLPLYPIDNIVFMGMGEPGDNIDAVVKACNVLVDPHLFGISQRRITISTVGPNPHVFIKLASQTSVPIAWSVHVVNDEKRKQLVPTTEYSMMELRQGVMDALLSNGRRSRSLQMLMIEITLLDHINDTIQDAYDLITFCKPLQESLSKVIINLIPWNDINSSSNNNNNNRGIIVPNNNMNNNHYYYKTPSMERIITFQNILIQNGLRCYIRTTRGDDTSSACGQLATNSRRAARRSSSDNNSSSSNNKKNQSSSSSNVRP